MTALPLRKTGPLLEPLGVETEAKLEPPRALKSLAQIVNEDLCHRCGSCIGICPTNVLAQNEEGYPVVKNLSSCTDCDLCVRVCPGDEFSVPSLAKQLFNKVPEIQDMHGHFEEAFLCYANDAQVRLGSTSGGAITGLLLHLLETKKIDGALLVASDKNIPWKGQPILARTREEILSTMKSKYAICPTNIMLKEVLEHPGRYALVGLPCQIHGYLKAARLNKKIKERIILSIGLFCHAAVEHDPMHQIWGDIDPEIKAQTKNFVSRIGKHPGTPHLELQDGSFHPVYFPQAKNYRPSSMEILNILYRLYTPSRCMTCYDSTAEFADIAVGDPWMAPPDNSIDFYQGYSFVLARTNQGLNLLNQASQAQALKLVTLDPKHARTSNVMMGHEKRGRAFRIIETRRRQGLPVPDYGIITPKASGKEFVLTEINIFTHIFCFLNWGKKPLLKLTFSPIGYSLLWLNNLRRMFRTWRRDAFYKLKKKFNLKKI